MGTCLLKSGSSPVACFKALAPLSSSNLCGSNHLFYTRDLQDKVTDPETENGSYNRGDHKFDGGGHKVSDKAFLIARL